MKDPEFAVRIEPLDPSGKPTRVVGPGPGWEIIETKTVYDLAGDLGGIFVQTLWRHIDCYQCGADWAYCSCQEAKP